MTGSSRPGQEVSHSPGDVCGSGVVPLDILCLTHPDDINIHAANETEGVQIMVDPVKGCSLKPRQDEKLINSYKVKYLCPAHTN